MCSHAWPGVPFGKGINASLGRSQSGHSFIEALFDSLVV